MTKIKPGSDGKDNRLTGRSAYTRPKLREFGPIGALTQAGTGGMSEYMASNMMCSGSANQQAGTMC